MKTEKLVKTWQTPVLQAVEMKSTAGGSFPTSVEAPPFTSEFVLS